MASICRSAVLAAARSVTIRTKTVLPNPSPSRRAVTTVCRPLASILGGMESLRPLHSAIASARLISNIAVDTSYWSCVSQGHRWSDSSQWKNVKSFNNRADTQLEQNARQRSAVYVKKPSPGGQ